MVVKCRSFLNDENVCIIVSMVLMIALFSHCSVVTFPEVRIWSGCRDPTYEKHTYTYTKIHQKRKRYEDDEDECNSESNTQES